MNNILVQAPRLLNKHKKCKRFITSYQTKIRKEVFIMSIKLYNINEEYREKFYQIPKVFFTNPKYIKLSNDAKMAWGILRDRLDLSIKMVGLILKQVIFIFITKMKTHKIY